MVKSREDLCPPDHVDIDETRAGEKLTIIIDSKRYRPSAPVMNGAQLRRLAEPDISPEYDLWQEVPGDEDNLVEDKERVKLRNGMGFYSSSCEINPG